MWISYLIGEFFKENKISPEILLNDIVGVVECSQ